jgi:hypothetical protein
MEPQNSIDLDAGTARQTLRLIDALEENDDVQEVYANFDISTRSWRLWWAKRSTGSRSLARTGAGATRTRRSPSLSAEALCSEARAEATGRAAPATDLPHSAGRIFMHAARMLWSVTGA